MASRDIDFTGREIGVAIAALEDYTRALFSLADLPRYRKVDLLKTRFIDLQGTTLLVSDEELELLESAVLRYTNSRTAGLLLAKLRSFS